MLKVKEPQKRFIRVYYRDLKNALIRKGFTFLSVKERNSALKRNQFTLWGNLGLISKREYPFIEIVGKPKIKQEDYYGVSKSNTH